MGGRGVEVVSRYAVIASDIVRAVGAIGDTSLASEQTVQKISSSTEGARGRGGASCTIAKRAGALTVVDHDVVLLIEVLALQIDEAEGRVGEGVGRGHV